MSTLRERAANARYIARHPVKMARHGATATRWHNWRNQRAIAKGRAPRLDGAIAAVTSRTPVVRNRINPAHGNPRREDARLHRSSSESLRSLKEQRQGARPVTVRSQLGRGLERLDAETARAQRPAPSAGRAKGRTR